MARTTIWLMCAAAGLAVACSPRRTSEADDRATLNRLREEFVAAENRGDADAMYSQLAPDVIVMAPNMPPMGGPQLTPEALRSFFEMFSYDNRYQSQEIVISGDWAFDRGIGTEIVTNKKDGTVTKRMRPFPPTDASTAFEAGARHLKAAILPPQPLRSSVCEIHSERSARVTLESR